MAARKRRQSNWTSLVAASLVLLVCTAVLAAEPANPQAAPAARRVLDYFHALSAREEGQRILSGQFSGFGNAASLSIAEEIRRKTGHWPALIGVDYADISRGNKVSSIATRVPNQVAIAYWKQGGLVTVMAHMYNPANPSRRGLRDRGVKLGELLDEGTETNRHWQEQLDLLAAGLLELKAAGVVVLWRPFHEMNGGWFWWGNHDPASFIRVWRHMFDYFTKIWKLDNLLWVYSPIQGRNTTRYYPGDDYVDIVALDAYTDFVDRRRIRGYDQIAALPKPFGFAEYGPHGSRNPPGDYDYRRFLAGILQHFPRTCFFMAWNANWSLASNYFTKELLSDPAVVNRDDLPRVLFGARE